ncbi:hypothetical protein JMJ77_0001624 [Colletotrichum scovillei]|uniref:Uncharacterized protein n=1 Tax=Colletotrichum scovillei TaxID=1209932 RepID=A0A9P7R6A4_9PEZI|nr:hypothetical protein JMJ77_0001624 [Colletotrichum scovillei]KAG7070033.1 hypothetical protein JMJ76_0001291 [Colletotrichum scovillei]KAG7078259.1 hypothetical protein JMJ78_0001933 [Colletotrichum scovillei]
MQLKINQIDGKTIDQSIPFAKADWLHLHLDDETNTLLDRLDLFPPGLGEHM